MDMTKMTADQMKAMIAKLAAENASLKASRGSLGLKVSEKKAVSVTGVGRFPVTLYAPTWERVLDFGPQIREFIEANRDKLSWSKADKED